MLFSYFRPQLPEELQILPILNFLYGFGAKKNRAERRLFSRCAYRRSELTEEVAAPSKLRCLYAGATASGLRKVLEVWSDGE